MLKEVRFVCVDDLVSIRFLVSYIVEFLLEIVDVGIFLELILSFFLAILFLLNFLLQFLLRYGLGLFNRDEFCKDFRYFEFLEGIRFKDFDLNIVLLYLMLVEFF